MKGTQLNKVFISCLFIALIWTGSCDTHRNIEPPDDSHFVKYYGTDENEKGIDLILLTDGSLLLLGTTDEGTKRIYLVKVDSKGNVIWEKYLGDDTDVAKDIEPTIDGNFVILADYTSNLDNTDIKIIKVDSDGNKSDSVVYILPKNQIARSITPLLDGGFIVTGATEFTEAFPKPGNIANDRSDVFHFRFDAGLDLNHFNWGPQYGAETFDAGAKIFQHAANDFFVFGYSDHDHPKSLGNMHLLYYLIGGGGVVNNSPNYLGNPLRNTVAAYVMKEPPDFGGGYFIIGTRTSPTGTDLHVSKLRSPLQFNLSNDVLLDTLVSLGPSLEAVSAAASLTSGPQGYFLLANEMRLTGTHNISLTKIEQSGDVLWTVSLGSEEKDDLAAAVTELSNGRIIVLGTIVIGDQTKMALFKLNSQGRLMK